jgi:hypothetical protein
MGYNIGDIDIGGDRVLCRPVAVCDRRFAYRCQGGNSRSGGILPSDILGVQQFGVTGLAMPVAEEQVYQCEYHTD